jgi:hypothetical protein
MLLVDDVGGCLDGGFSGGFSGCCWWVSSGAWARGRVGGRVDVGVGAVDVGAVDVSAVDVGAVDVDAVDVGPWWGCLAGRSFLDGRRK